MKFTSTFLALLAAALLLAGCRGFETAAPTATGLPSATSTSSATAEALQSATSAVRAGPQATLAGSDCLAEGGRLVQHQIESDYMDSGLRFRVYTPPCYRQQAQRSFPVLYLFHGQTYNDDQWDRLGADEAADALIGAGELPPFLIVMPYYSSSNQPSANPFERAVLEELLPWMEANYRVLTDRQNQAVGGLSMGASWAIHFGLTQPQRFGVLAGHSPPVFVEDANFVREWLEEMPSEQRPRIWLDIGDRDQAAILASAQWFEELLTEMEIPHEWHLFAGRHDEAYWSEHVELYLRWYAGEW